MKINLPEFLPSQIVFSFYFLIRRGRVELNFFFRFPCSSFVQPSSPLSCDARKKTGLQIYTKGRRSLSSFYCNPFSNKRIRGLFCFYIRRWHFTYLREPCEEGKKKRPHLVIISTFVHSFFFPVLEKVYFFLPIFFTRSFRNG